MKTQHTPGPWEVDGYHVRQSGQYGTRMIADVCYTGPHHTPPDQYPKSCRITDESNARLIAAAPDLLEVLEDAFKCIPSTLQKRARAAITKAKGETP